MNKPRFEWWEEYGCGCVSEIVPRKKDLCGYCPTHGDDAINRFKDQNMRDQTIHSVYSLDGVGLKEKGSWAGKPK